MITSFVGKAIPTLVRIPGKRVGVKVVWKYNRFVGKIDKTYFEIDSWKDLTHSKYIYSLPTNSYCNNWYRKPYIPITDPDALAMTLRFWGKYREGMTIYGRIMDNVFHEVIRNPTTTLSFFIGGDSDIEDITVIEIVDEPIIKDEEIEEIIKIGNHELDLSAST